MKTNWEILKDMLPDHFTSEEEIYKQVKKATVKTDMEQPTWFQIRKKYVKAIVLYI